MKKPKISVSECERSKAKLKFTIDAMEPFLEAALAAAHEHHRIIADDDPFRTEKDAYVDRMLDMGVLANDASKICDPSLDVLWRVARKLLALHDREANR